MLCASTVMIKVSGDNSGSPARPGRNTEAADLRRRSVGDKSSLSSILPNWLYSEFIAQQGIIVVCSYFLGGMGTRTNTSFHRGYWHLYLGQFFGGSRQWPVCRLS